MRTKAILALCLAAIGCHVTPLVKVERPAITTVELPVTFHNGSPRELEVQLHSGLVVVEPGPELWCELQVDLTGPHGDDLATLVEQTTVVLEEDLESGKTTLRVSQPQGAPLSAVHARYRLRVPSQVRLRVHTRAGEVHLRGFNGDVEVQSDSGLIEARMGGGSADLTTKTGRIRLIGSYSEAALRSESGAVEASIPSNGAQVSLELISIRGPVLVGVPDTSVLALEYRGQPGLIRSEIPVQWLWADDENPFQAPSASRAGC